jgi:hypothetical protein
LAWSPGEGASVSVEFGVGSPGASAEVKPNPRRGLEQDGLSIYRKASGRIGPVGGEAKMDDCGDFKSPEFQPKARLGPACFSKDGLTGKIDPKKGLREQFSGVGMPKARAGVKVSLRLW